MGITWIDTLREIVPLWMQIVIVVEVIATILIIVQSQLGLFAVLEKGTKAIKNATSAPELDSIIENMNYKGRKFIYEYFSTNIQNGTNVSGKQASEFINEDKILKSFPHIQLLKLAPSLITSAGLCCTFIAILIGLSDVQVSSDGNIQGIQSLVNNLSGKFSTSIVALLLAIILNIYSSLIFSKMHEMFFVIKNKIDFLYPIKSIAEIFVQNSGISSFATQLTTHLNSAVADISKLLSSDEIQTQIQNGTNMIDKLSKSLTALEQHTQTINNVAQQMSEATTQLETFNTKLQGLENIAKTLESISTTLEKDNKTLSDNYDVIHNQLPQMADKFGEVCEQIKGHLQSNIQASFTNALTEAVAGKITETLDECIVKIKDIITDKKSTETPNQSNIGLVPQQKNSPNIAQIRVNAPTTPINNPLPKPVQQISSTNNTADNKNNHLAQPQPIQPAKINQPAQPIKTDIPKEQPVIDNQQEQKPSDTKISESTKRGWFPWGK